MTDNQHPITPPPELVEQWATGKNYDDCGWIYEIHIATQAAQWGADQELEACCEWLASQPLSMRKIPDLRSFRRPKPLSLKEQALEVLERCCFVNPVHENIIRGALEQLDD